MTDRSLRWIRPPQQARSQETLVRILDAAEALVTEKGFEDATVAEIARRAGSSVGAFYTRFRDKDGLLYELYARHFEQAVATADDALDPRRWEDLGVTDIVREVVRFLVEIYRERVGLLRVFAIRSHSDHAFRERQDRLSTYVSEKLTELLMARGEEIPRSEPRRRIAFGLAMAFAALENAVLFDELHTGSIRFSDAELAEELTYAYLVYLGVPTSDTHL